MFLVGLQESTVFFPPLGELEEEDLGSTSMLLLPCVVMFTEPLDVSREDENPQVLRPRQGWLTSRQPSIRFRACARQMR